MAELSCHSGSDHADSYASRVVDVDPEVMKRLRLVLKLLVNTPKSIKNANLKLRNKGKSSYLYTDYRALRKSNLVVK